VRPGSDGPVASFGNQSVAGKLFRTTQWNGTGLVGFNRIAIDSAQSMVFSVNQYANTVSSFSAVTQAPGPYLNLGANVTPGSPEFVPVDIAFDPIHHLVDVAEYIYPNDGGQIELLNESTLRPVGAIPLPSNFTPALMAFDASDGQIVLANATDAIAVVSSAVDAVVSMIPSACNDPETCYLPQLVPMGGHHEVLAFLQSGGPIEAINTTTGTRTAFPTVPGGFNAGAYDRVHDVLWLATSSSLQLDRVDPINGSLETSVPFSSSSVSSMAVDPVTGDLIVASTNRSVQQEVWEFSFTGGMLYHYRNLSSNETEPSSFYELACGAFGTLQLLVTAGATNGTTQEFEFFGAAPYGTPYASIPSVPVNLIGAAIDSALGLVFQYTEVPTAVTAYWEANGSVAWIDNYTIGIPQDNPGFALDSASGRLYIAPPTNETLLTVDAATGQVLATTPTIGGEDYLLAADPVHDWLYLAGGSYTTAQVQIFSISSTTPTSLGTLTVPASTPYLCSMLADPALSVAFAGSRSTPGQLFEISGSSLSIVHTFDTGLIVVGTALATDGNLYYSTFGSTHVTVLDPTTDQFLGNFSSGVRLISLTYWPSTGLLFGGNYNGTVTVLNATTQTFVGNLTLPGPGWLPVFDPTTSTLWTWSLLNGDTLEATWVPPPTGATGLSATGGNNSAIVVWTGGSSPAGYPITYEVQAQSADGPNETTSASGPVTTMSGLVDGRTYAVTVSATTLAGSGGVTGPVDVTPLGVPYPPTLATAVAGNASFSFFWSPPSSDDGAPILNYSVHYTVVGTGTWAAVSAGTSTSSTVSGVANGVPVIVYVQATNGAGTSEPSGEVTVIPTATPANPSPPSPTPTPTPTPKTPPAPANNNLTAGGLLLTDALVAVAIVVARIAVALAMRKDPPPPSSPPTGGVASPTTGNAPPSS
jgi:hypothetical protein